VAFDRVAVLRTDVDIHSDHRPLADQLQQRRHEQHGAATRHSGLDDDIGLGVPNHLLRCHHVGRQLDDRNAHPTPEIGVVVLVRRLDRLDRGFEHLRIAAQSDGLRAFLLLERRAIVGIGH
jgi:hypothetical protein